MELLIEEDMNGPGKKFGINGGALKRRFQGIILPDAPLIMQGRVMESSNR